MAENPSAIMARAYELNNVKIDGLHLRWARSLTAADNVGRGNVFELLVPRSAEHQKSMPGEQNTIIIWVLDNGYAHFHLESCKHVTSPDEPNLTCKHVSLKDESYLKHAFDTKRFDTLLEGVEAPKGTHWGYRSKEVAIAKARSAGMLWLALLITVYTITWAAPSANALASIMLYKHMRATAAVELRDLYAQLPSRQLLAELADLEEMRSSISIMPAADWEMRYPKLTPEQLPLNPLSFLGLDAAKRQYLNWLYPYVETDDPEKSEDNWLEQLRTNPAFSGVSDASKRAVGLQMTLVDNLLRNLALEIDADQQLVEEEQQLERELQEAGGMLQCQMRCL
ncbi:hypothetical protein OEZ86_001722 [Tetradesmus obliquus]|nr:hypothetical protein OEZ86_001722 [Tetradesmus obliquus]